MRGTKRKKSIDGSERGRRIRTIPETHESDFLRVPEGFKRLTLRAFRGGQRKPHPCPEDCLTPELPPFLLGGPIDIEDVALILGCSPWTVRQKYLPQGLPHLRASAAGKLVFFRDQIVGWILERQEKQTKGG